MGSPWAERRRPADWLLLFGVTELVCGVGTGAQGSPGMGEHWKCSIVSTVEVKIKVQKCFPGRCFISSGVLGGRGGGGEPRSRSPPPRPCLSHSGEGRSETEGIGHSSRHGNISEHQCQCAVWPRVGAAASGSLCTPGPAPSALREGGVCPQREAWQGASSQIQAEPWSWGPPRATEKGHGQFPCPCQLLLPLWPLQEAGGRDLRPECQCLQEEAGKTLMS